MITTVFIIIGAITTILALYHAFKNGGKA